MFHSKQGLARGPGTVILVDENHWLGKPFHVRPNKKSHGNCLCMCMRVCICVGAGVCVCEGRGCVCCCVLHVCVCSCPSVRPSTRPPARPPASPPASHSYVMTNMLQLACYGYYIMTSVLKPSTRPPVRLSVRPLLLHVHMHVVPYMCF